MSRDPHQPANPAAGDHYVVCTRPFRALALDPAHTIRNVWIAEPIACPACDARDGLRLAYLEGADLMVTAVCPRRHEWLEQRVDRAHFRAYSRLRFGLEVDADDLWILGSGFGEEPPPPLDIADIRAAAGEVAKVYRREAKSAAKAAVRKPARRARRAVQQAAHHPISAALRTMWIWQAGGMPEPGGQEPPEAEFETPAYAKYRKALGIPSQTRGPRCLVCEDTGTIPGTPITCTECAGPAAAAMAAAQRRAERARRP